MMLSKEIFNPNHQNLREGFFPSLFLDSFFKDVGREHFLSTKGEAFCPRVNILETQKEYQMQVELPGMQEKDFEVSVEDGVLEISGEKRQHHQEKNASLCIEELQIGKFQRHFRLPKGIDSKGIKAHFEHGLLSITLQKTSNPKKKIQIS